MTFQSLDAKHTLAKLCVRSCTLGSVLCHFAHYSLLSKVNTLFCSTGHALLFQVCSMKQKNLLMRCDPVWPAIRKKIPNIVMLPNCRNGSENRNGSEGRNHILCAMVPKFSNVS